MRSFDPLRWACLPPECQRCVWPASDWWCARCTWRKSSEEGCRFSQTLTIRQRQRHHIITYLWAGLASQETPAIVANLKRHKCGECSAKKAVSHFKDDLFFWMINVNVQDLQIGQPERHCLAHTTVHRLLTLPKWAHRWKQLNSDQCSVVKQWFLWQTDTSPWHKLIVLWLDELKADICTQH